MILASFSYFTSVPVLCLFSRDKATIITSKGYNCSVNVCHSGRTVGFLRFHWQRYRKRNQYLVLFMEIFSDHQIQQETCDLHLYYILLLNLLKINGNCRLPFDRSSHGSPPPSRPQPQPPPRPVQACSVGDHPFPTPGPVKSVYLESPPTCCRVQIILSNSHTPYIDEYAQYKGCCCRPHYSCPIKIEHIPNRAEVGINISLNSLLRSSYTVGPWLKGLLAEEFHHTYFRINEFSSFFEVFLIWNPIFSFRIFLIYTSFVQISQTWFFTELRCSTNHYGSFTLPIDKDKLSYWQIVVSGNNDLTSYIFPLCQLQLTTCDASETVAKVFFGNFEWLLKLAEKVILGSRLACLL